MAAVSVTESYLRQLTPDALRAAIANFLPQDLGDVKRAELLESALGSEAGPKASL